MTLIDQLKKIAIARHSLNLLAVTLDKERRYDPDDYESLVVGDTGISRRHGAVFVAVDTVHVLKYDLREHRITWAMHSPALEAHVAHAVDITIERLEDREQKDREWERQRQQRDQDELKAFKDRFGIIDPPAPESSMGQDLQDLDHRLRTFAARH